MDFSICLDVKFRLRSGLHVGRSFVASGCSMGSSYLPYEYGVYNGNVVLHKWKSAKVCVHGSWVTGEIQNPKSSIYIYMYVMASNQGLRLCRRSN